MTPTQFIKNLDHPQKAELKKIDAMIRAARPSAKPKVWEYGGGSMIGYGLYEYTYDSGRSGEWFVVGCAPRKGYISLYAMATRDGKYLTEIYQEKLGPVKIGKSCVNIKDLAAIDEKALRRFIKEAFTEMKKNCKARGWKVSI